MSIFRRFEQSPFEPLNAHMGKVKECVALVPKMFEAVRAANFEELQRLCEQVFKLEHDADRIKNDIRQEMPTTFYLPIYRGDLLAYLKLQDDVADSAEDIAVGLTIKRLTLPDELAKELQEFVNRVMQVCELMFKCSDQLANLVEDDFGGPRVGALLELVADAEHAEWRADKAQYTIVRKLFSLDDKLKATEIMLWSNVFRELGRLANHADNAAERLRRMLAR